MIYDLFIGSEFDCGINFKSVKEVFRY